MPFSYHIEKASSILWVEIADPTSMEEIFAGVQRLVADPELYPGLNVLSDHRALDYVASADLMRVLPGLFEQLAEKIGPHRTAVVAANETSFGMIRMAEMLADENAAQLKACWTIEEAHEWLAGIAPASDD